jgi:hypothetical protein
MLQFMAAFWEENPHHGVEFETLLSEKNVAWPNDFPTVVSKNKNSNTYTRTLKCDAIAPLRIDEMCERVPPNNNSSNSASVDKNEWKDGIDLMSNTVFTSCEGLLGLGMKSEREGY